ncbi:MAG: tyrosine-type recombinase/integrase [Candidatus Cloacimonetes bacterium]|nr:tyrosine-type recombinase/integrase [Candidatus Cloacimonadota bacterium]
MNDVIKTNIDNTSIVLSLRNLSKNAQKNYLRTAKQFMEFIGKDLKFTSESDILNFIEHLESQGMKNATINNKRYGLQSLFSALVKDGVMPLNPVKELAHKISNAGKKLNRPVDIVKKNKLELPAIHEACKKQDKTALIISFLKGCGCRVSEMIGIKLTDIKENGDYYAITIHGKGGKYRIIDVDQLLISVIKEKFQGQTYLFETRTGKQYHRCAVYRMITLRFLKQGIKAGCHMLRHFFATTLIESKYSLKAIADYLGHSSFHTLLKYYDHSKIPIEARFIK